MSYRLVFAQQFQKNFKRLTKKNSVLRERILKRIEEIAVNPDIGEHLAQRLAGKQAFMLQSIRFLSMKFL